MSSESREFSQVYVWPHDVNSARLCKSQIDLQKAIVLERVPDQLQLM